MTQRILIELALFSLPFLVFYMYRAASRNLSVKDRWPLMWLVIIGGALAGGGILLKALSQPSDKGLCYQSSRYEDRVFIPAQKVPCDQVVYSKSKGATAAADENSAESQPLAPTARDLPTVMEPKTQMPEETEKDGN